MSTYLAGIIPYDFTNLNNQELAISEINTILHKLQSHWHLEKGFSVEIEKLDFNSTSSYRIELPNGFGYIELKNGFIYLDSTFSHRQYFTPFEGKMWLSNLVYDIAVALDKDVVYLGDEFHFENHDYGDKDWYDYNFTLNDWKAEYPNIPIHHDSMDSEQSNWECLFQETFTTNVNRKTLLQKKFPNYRILTTANYGDWFILAIDHSNNLVLINEQTNNKLNCGKIDGLYQNFNSAGFLIYKGGQKSIFLQGWQKNHIL